MTKIQNAKLGAGFTLVELILYVAVVAVIVSALVPLAWNTIGNSAKSSVQQEVAANARHISEIIKYEIRRASGLSAVTPTTLTLNNFSPDTTTTFQLNGTNLQINRNGAGYVNLNSPDTQVTGLAFTNYTSGDNKTKNIQFSFTVSTNTTSTRQEYQQSVTIEGDGEVRSN